MIISNRLKKSKHKCPECGYDCLYNTKLDLYACNRPIVLSDGSKGGSCGKFYSNGMRFK